MSFVAACQNFTYGLSHYAARLLATLAFQVRCFGREHVPATGGALVCANHQSFLDPVLVGLTCDRTLHYVARSDLFRIPVFGSLIDWYNAIPIDLEGNSLGGIKETLKRVRQGNMVLLFPEGTRTRDGNLQPLRPGIASLARRAGVPILPVGIDGAFDAWPRTQRLPSAATIHIHVGPPLAAESLAAWDEPTLLAHLNGAIGDLFAKAQASRRAAAGLADASHPNCEAPKSTKLEMAVD